MLSCFQEWLQHPAGSVLVLPPYRLLQASCDAVAVIRNGLLALKSVCNVAEKCLQINNMFFPYGKPPAEENLR